MVELAPAWNESSADLNRNMIVFDLLLGSGALFAPQQTLAIIGHDEPSEDAEHLFRRCGPIWLTFAAAHFVAHRRGSSKDWWALAWLRGTELLTDIVWARSELLLDPGPGPECGSPARRTSGWRSASPTSPATAGRRGSAYFPGSAPVFAASVPVSGATLQSSRPTACASFSLLG